MKPWAVWPDLAKIHHLGKIFLVLDNFLDFFLLFGKFWGLLWQILYGIRQVFIDVDGQMLKNHLVTLTMSYIPSLDSKRKSHHFLQFEKCVWCQTLNEIHE